MNSHSDVVKRENLRAELCERGLIGDEMNSRLIVADDVFYHMDEIIRFEKLRNASACPEDRESREMHIAGLEQDVRRASESAEHDAAVVAQCRARGD